MKQMLVKSDPYGSVRCRRKWCIICKKEELEGAELEGIKVSCYKPGVGYTIECTRTPCMENGVSRAHYEGESSRSGSIRLGQHFDLYKRDTIKAKEASWMWEHSNSHHGGMRGENQGLADFKPSITGMFNEPLVRLLDEGVRTKNRMDSHGEISMNGRNEYYKAEYVRLNVRRYLVNTD